MSKIVIKEYDKTKAATGSYANFSVLIPGFVRPRTKSTDGSEWLYGGRETFDGSLTDAGKSVFDENGVYECSSKADFLKYIGKVSAYSVEGVAAIAPTVTELKDFTYNDLTTVEDKFEAITDLLDSGELPFGLYTKEELKPAGTSVGLLRTTSHKFIPVSKTETTITITPEGGGEPKQEKIKDYVYNSTANYVVIYNDQKGNDEVKAVEAHYGNQIAYELLDLGYTVLYKTLGTLDPNTHYLTAGTEDIANITNTTKALSFWEPLKDKATYDFRYVMTGMVTNNYHANEAIISLVNHVNTSTTGTGRGDCIALIDIDSTKYSGMHSSSAVSSIAAEASLYTANQYTAIFAPSVTYDRPFDTGTDAYKNNTFPASFHYLACAAKAAENYSEWYAIAGYNRGTSKYNILGTGVKLGENAVNALAPRQGNDDIDKAVNLIIKIKNNYYLWGNRTAYELTTEGDNAELRASHFLNIRQLCTTLKKQVYVACRRFTFEPNSDLLWINFCNAIRPTLERMKADQGIADYKFVKVKNDKKALLTAKIRIVPIEAVEDFEISVYLEDSLAGVVVGTDEIDAE